MDWKLDRQRREKAQALAIKSAAKSINIMDEMEREFTHIFGDGRTAEFAENPDKSRNSAEALRSSRPCKAPNPDWAPEAD